jgi:putative SOS response-associated peptidase YedK
VRNAPGFIFGHYLELQRLSPNDYSNGQENPNRYMCGRYKLTAKEQWLSDYFNLDPEDVDWVNRWNVAPTQEVATIRQDRKEPKRIFALMRWGLIPYWAKDASIASKTINAVSETAAEKPVFREAMRRRRCLVPADGFYEWKRIGPKLKQTYNIGLRDDGLFAFAGLWDRWKNPEGKPVETCTILTTEANALLADIHDRMPVILSPEDYDDARLMRKYPVSDFVNRADNEGPECAREVEADSAVQQKLW